MKKPFEKWGGLPIRRSDRVLSLTTLAEAAPADNAVTVEKLLKAMRDLPKIEDPFAGVDVLYCSERMASEAWRLAAALEPPSIGMSIARRRIRVVASGNTPDGYIVAQRPGKNPGDFPEVVAIIGPEKKP